MMRCVSELISQIQTPLFYKYLNCWSINVVRLAAVQLTIVAFPEYFDICVIRWFIEGRNSSCGCV